MDGAAAGPVDDRVDTLLAGTYRIVRKIGEGGMGAVYEARHERIEWRCAVKFLLPELAADERAVKRFEHEARAAAAVGHPNIVDVTDMGTADDGSHYQVLEYLDGCDFEAAPTSSPPSSR